MNPAYIQISSKNNEIYRKDRVSDNHGGVFQAVKKYTIVTYRDDINTDCEIIWTQCQIQNKRSKSLFFASFYRPIKNDINSLVELWFLISLRLLNFGYKLNTNNVIVAGDFNAPDLKWKDHDETNCSSSSGPPLGIIKEHGLTQLVHEPTRRQGEAHSIIDLVLTNSDKIINNVRVIPGISNHDMVLFEINLACRQKKPVKRKIYIGKRADTLTQSV